jgi:hypothetical protein
MPRLWRRSSLTRCVSALPTPTASSACGRSLSTTPHLPLPSACAPPRRPLYLCIHCAIQSGSVTLRFPPHNDNGLDASLGAGGCGGARGACGGIRAALQGQYARGRARGARVQRPPRSQPQGAYADSDRYGCTGLTMGPSATASSSARLLWRRRPGRQPGERAPYGADVGCRGHLSPWRYDTPQRICTCRGVSLTERCVGGWGWVGWGGGGGRAWTDFDYNGAVPAGCTGAPRCGEREHVYTYALAHR